MKIKLFSAAFMTCFIAMSLFMGSCKKEETPTKTKMEGVWMVTAATDDGGQSFTLSFVERKSVVWRFSIERRARAYIGRGRCGRGAFQGVGA